MDRIRVFTKSGFCVLDRVTVTYTHLRAVVLCVTLDRTLPYNGIAATKVVVGITSALLRLKLMQLWLTLSTP